MIFGSLLTNQDDSWNDKWSPPNPASGVFPTLDVLRPYLPDLGLPSMEATMFCTDLLEFPFRKVIQDPRFLNYLPTNLP